MSHLGKKVPLETSRRKKDKSEGSQPRKNWDISINQNWIRGREMGKGNMATREGAWAIKLQKKTAPSNSIKELEI